jgi:predicted TIM-barrel fold metal-dependent hydrolase
MDSGPNSPITDIGTPPATLQETEELVNLTVPEDPDELFEEILVDGTLDIDTVRRDDSTVDPTGEGTTQSVARATSDGSKTASTLDEPLPKLPVVDIHCHIHGVSLSKTKSALKDFKQHGLFHGNDLKTPKKREAFQKSLNEYYEKKEEKYKSRLNPALQLGHWNFLDDPWVAKKIITSTQSFQDATERQDIGNPIIITPMLLDFGYTPLGTSVASKAAKVKGSGDSMNETNARLEELADTGIYYFSKSAKTQRDHRFFTRDDAMFRHQVEILHMMATLWPGQIMPFCPYDPRRPNCLDVVKAAMDTQSYVGVKLYARCGWMPTNNAALHGTAVGKILDDRLDEFYAYVTANDIPILNHTSPTGHPPEGALVYPWRMTAEANPDDRLPATKAAPTGYPPSNWTQPDLFVKGRSKQQRSLDKMTFELTGFGFYCLYDQLTTSPYSWEPVLEKYPKLRLCFAHFGSKLASYANPRYSITSDAAAADCEVLLQKNPMVAGSTGDRTFAGYFKKGAVRNRYDKKIKDEHAQESADKLFVVGKEWDCWLEAWSEKYPDDWGARITKLVTKYENVYTDISFITGNQTSFNDIVGPIFQDALEQRGGAGRLFDKAMIGTDWYMTEMASLSPGDFWRLVEKACKMDKATFSQLPEPERAKRAKVWDQWATKNALRYLNVKPRLGGTGMDKLVNAYGCTVDKLPPWWKTLEKFYDKPEKIEPPK